MSIFDNIRKGEDQFIKHAEEIFLDNKAELWNIDVEKGRTAVLVSSTWRENNKMKSETKTMTLADHVAKAISDYEIERGGFSWTSAARDLIRAYNYANTLQAVVRTEGFIKRFRELEEENRSLRKAIDDITKEKDGMISNLRKESDGFKKRWEDCETSKQNHEVETSVVEDAGDSH
jgi:hypothetical protein